MSISMVPMLPLYFLQSKKFYELLFSDEKYEFLGYTPNLGRRIKFLGITMDLYVCEQEPEIVPVKGMHTVVWHVPKSKDVYENIKKTGWFGPFGKYIPSANPVPFIDVQDPKYFDKWSNRKKTYRHSWIKQLEKNELSILPCNLEKFLEHYLNSGLPKKIKKFNHNQMMELVKIYNSDITFFLVKDIKLDKIIGGLGTLYDYDLSQLIKQFSFLDKTYKNIGVGLMDHCVYLARQAGLKHLCLTLINTSWHKARTWNGFTRFKLEFNPIILYFRQSYIKISFKR